MQESKSEILRKDKVHVTFWGFNIFPLQLLLENGSANCTSTLLGQSKDLSAIPSLSEKIICYYL